MHKLVIVDGIMGSGKSTTTDLIAKYLQRKGVAVRTIGEGATGHPVQMGDPESSDSTATWMEERLDKWRRFRDELLSADELVVLDGQLYHENVDALVYFDVPASDITAYIGRLEDELAPLHPLLIHFYQRDIRAALRRVFDLRGEGWEQWQIDWKLHNRPYGQHRGLRGFDGFVQLYGAHRHLTDELFATSAMAKLAIQNEDGDWERYMAEIMTFLDRALAT